MYIKYIHDNYLISKFPYNMNRLSKCNAHDIDTFKPKLESKPTALKHGDIVQFGCTRLLLHIHTGSDTCEECEPGLVQAQIQSQNQPADKGLFLKPSSG